jgi:hypothetical protein
MVFLYLLLGLLLRVFSGIVGIGSGILIAAGFLIGGYFGGLRPVTSVHL